jgi:hypothetical protein
VVVSELERNRNSEVSVILDTAVKKALLSKKEVTFE